MEGTSVEARNADIGARLRAFRKSQGMAVEEFVDTINNYLGEKFYAREQVYKMETGTSKIQGLYMVHISEVFNTPLDFLIFGEKVISEKELEQIPEYGRNCNNRVYWTYIMGELEPLSEKEEGVKDILSKYKVAIMDIEKLSRDIVYLKGQLNILLWLLGERKGKD